MACPSSGPISFAQIGYETSIAAPYSLRTMSLVAEKSTPDSMHEFHGYGNHFYIIGCTAAKPSYSRDGGAHWADISTGSLATVRMALNGTYNYKDAYCTRDVHDLVIDGFSGTTSRIATSHDDGSTWSYQQKSGCILDWASVTPGNGHWYLGGWTYSAPYKSVDNGNTFTLMTMPASEIPLAFSGSYDGHYVYAGCGTIRAIIRSTDDGSTWTRVTLPGAGGTHTLCTCDDSGQYVLAYYNSATSGVLGTHLSTNYGASFTSLSGGDGGQAGISFDASLMFYTNNVAGDPSNGLLWSTDRGSTWTKVTFPASWTTMDLAYSRRAKVIIASKSNAATQIYKLNDAKNNWDLMYNASTNIYGALNLSDSSYGHSGVIFNVATTYNQYYLRLDGSIHKIYTGTSKKFSTNVI